jgi:hypothetical protein
VPEVPAVPPAQFRDEATVVSNSDSVVWLDPNYTVLNYEGLGGGYLNSSIAVTSDGIVVSGHGAGTEPCITRWDTDLNADNTFFVPDDGWPQTGDMVGDLCFTDDEKYLYAVVSGPYRLIKFDAATGDEVWHVHKGGSYYTIAVDDDDNVYTMGLSGAVIQWNSDGSIVLILDVGILSRDILIDSTNQRIYCTGKALTVDTTVSAIDFGGTNYNYFNTGGQGRGIIKIGDFIYVACSRHDHGVGGAYASVYKFDTSLNLIASYDTGLDSYGIWFDWEGRIAVSSGYYDGGEFGAGIWLLDTDLTYIADYRVENDVAYGVEGSSIPFMDAGTPGFPAVPGYEIETGLSDAEAKRLIPFECEDANPYVIALGDKKMAFFKSN